MTRIVELPLWVLVLLVAFATVTVASHFLFPSVRWFFRRRLEKAVARLNQRLERPIEPFRLVRRFDMIQRLIYDPGVSKAVAEHAKAENIPENVAFEKAGRYAREIVPSFSATLYFGFAIRAARFLSNALYRVEVDYLDEGAVHGIDKDATVVFVMNHRSNMDYVLVTHLVAERSALSYAVGEWANVWPLNRLIRAMGAYFIRRRSLNDLYRGVLARYVVLATSGNVTQAMFPEGGLSVDGALRQPKLGLLKYLVLAHEESARDIVFVPVGINYDRVLEDRILIASRHDPKGRFNASIGVIAGFALKLFWLWITRRYHPFGSAVVRYGKPLSLRDFGAQSPARRDASALTEDLGDELMTRIGDAVALLPVPLVAAVMRDGIVRNRSEIQQETAQLLSQAGLEDRAEAMVDEALALFERRRILSSKDDAWHCPPDQIEVCEYYMRSVEHILDLTNSATAK